MGLFSIFKRHSRKKKQASLKAKSLANEKAKANSSQNNVINEAQASSSVSASSEVSSSAVEASSVSSSVESSSSSESITSTSSNATKSSESASESASESKSASSEAKSASSSAESESAETKPAKSVETKSASSQSKESNITKTAKQNGKIYARGLARSRSTFGQKLNRLFANFRSVNDEFFDDLEDTLIESDVGVDMAVKISDALRKEVKLKNVKKRSEVQDVIIQKMIELYDEDGKNEDNQIHYAKQGPTVFLFVGVNGAGKTTIIGKMAYMYHQQGKKVLLAAADTFRAGAIQQLDEWAKNDHVDIVKRPEHSDPSSVVYDAVHKAKRENYDILFVDTAGRLQNKVNLMNQLSKMNKVLTRVIPDAPHEVMLVVDGTTGQNALNQAKLFNQVAKITGIVLTKLDGTAKGGIVLAIRHELHIPVKFIGFGEHVHDLTPFNASDFVNGLFEGLFK